MSAAKEAVSQRLSGGGRSSGGRKQVRDFCVHHWKDVFFNNYYYY
jgi:hypothetical protein